MSERVITHPGAPHLYSAVIACALPIAILCGGSLLALHFERKTIHVTAPKDFFIKTQGFALQRAALRSSNILLLFGSSELRDPAPNRASDFFSSAPSGFQVCPVGKAGATSLTILQKVATLGSELRGRKVATSISPSWFFTPLVNPDAYAGNFSLPAASGTLFGTGLDLNLKNEVAKRMLEFPDTLAKNGLLRVAATCLASGRPVDRMVFAAIWPLGWLQNVVLDLQDHFETLVYILRTGEAVPPRQSQLSNPQEMPVGADPENVTTEPPVATGASGDAAFRVRVAGASEWSDFDLLLRILAQAGAKPLILCMPIDGTRYELKGVSRSARQVYYERMRDIAGRYRVPLIQFEDHDADPSFLTAHHEHPTAKGWMYYNKALDDFFHKTVEANAAHSPPT